VDRLRLRFDHRVESLVTTNGRVTGCRGVLEGSGQVFEASGEAVIVASGGINGDLARVKANWHADWGRPPETILNGSHKFADGRLHDAAAAVGANITHLDWQWNYAAGVHHWQPRKPGHGLSLVPPKSALWLNWRGERIGPMPLVTGFDTHDLVAQICRQERAYSWQLLNRRIMLKELAISGGEFNPAFRRKNRLAVARDMVLGNHWLYDQMTEMCPDVVVAPIGFTSDHMEVLYDLDLEAKSRAIELGLNMVRAGTVGTHPRFVRMVRELLEERLSGAPVRLHLGARGPAPDVCPPGCCPAGRGRS